MPVIVLDSHALLALLRNEPAAAKVEHLLAVAATLQQPVLMTEVNYAEVQYIVRRKDGETTWASIARDLRAAPIEFYPADRHLADLAADFKARFSLSLADAFAAALAKDKSAELATGDPEFKALGKEITICWLGK
jgi:ribonuclease VapC